MANDSKTWRCGKYELSFDRPRIMGVLNVTPDSFSDGGEHFDPDAAITREQMAAILYRYAAYWELDVSAEADLSAYADASSVSGYAQAAMQWAVANGVINGTSATTLEPAGTATRAQAATVLVRFQNSMKS